MTGLAVRACGSRTETFCDTAGMPNADEQARAWQTDLAARIGRGVVSRRTTLLLTAAALSERTRNLGYPISPAVISKIENNERAGRIEVAELLVLAAALELPPMLLLFPGFPEGDEQILPGLTGSSEAGVRWVSGTDGLPGPVEGDGERGLYATSSLDAAIKLVESVNEARELRLEEFRLDIDAAARHDPILADAARQQISEVRHRLGRVLADIEDGASGLWDDRVDPQPP